MCRIVGVEREAERAFYAFSNLAFWRVRMRLCPERRVTSRSIEPVVYFHCDFDLFVCFRPAERQVCVFIVRPPGAVFRAAQAV
jgi:hypothetical protein